MALPDANKDTEGAAGFATPVRLFGARLAAHLKFNPSMSRHVFEYSDLLYP
jgi:hypothetical protein